MKNELDFLAIGDITIDAFIRLEEAGAHCHFDRNNLELCVNFGDKIPYEFVKIVRAVGNSPNAAVAAARLGLSSGLASNIGNDENGKECMEVLAREKVDTEFISVHNKMQTNYHYVLWYEDDRTILVKHQKYEYKLPEIGTPSFVYLSSLGPSAGNYNLEIADCLENNKDIKLVFQPGTFQIHLGAKKLERLYKRTDILAVNKKEAGQILNIKESGIRKLADGLFALGPKNVLITDGPKGAYFFDGKEILFMPPFPDPKPPFERTGAGDAYTSTFASAITLGKSAIEALAWAGINSMSVVQQIGAQKGLLTREEIEEYMSEAPKDYLPQKI